MDQVKIAFERIQVIAGVSGGVVTLSQVQSMARRHHLSDAQKGTLDAMLAENGIQPIPDDQMPRKPTPEAPKKTEFTPEQMEARIDRLLVLHLNRRSVSRAEAEQYLRERPVLKKFILEAADEPVSRFPSRIITHGVMELSRWRVHERLEEGYGCACMTYLNRCRDRLRHWLEFHFPESELHSFIRYCSGPDAGTEMRWEKLLLLLSLQTPAMLVRSRKISDYYRNT